MTPRAPVPHVCRARPTRSWLGRLLETIAGQLLAPLVLLAAFSAYLGGIAAFNPQKRAGRRGALNARRRILIDAEAAWQAAAYNPGTHGQWLKDITGNRHHMRLGSAGRAEVLDGALVTPGTTGNYARIDAESYSNAMPGGGTFESTAEGWAVNTSCTVARTTTAPITGTGSLLMTSTGAAGVTYSSLLQFIPLAAGTTYIFRARVKSAVAGRAVRLRGNVKDASNVTIATAFGSTVAGVTSGSAELYLAFTAPVNASTFQLLFEAPDAANATGEWHMLDDVVHYAPAGLDVVGDLDMAWIGAPDDWTPGSYAFLGKEPAGGLNRSYLLFIQGAGLPKFRFSIDGSTLLEYTATQATPWWGLDGAAGAIRVTRNRTTGVIVFYTSTDLGETWAPLGAPVAGTAGLMYAGSAAVNVAAHQDGNGSPVAGSTIRAWIKNGIDGPPVLDADFRQLADGTPWFIDATGKRVTIMPKRAVVVDGALRLPGISGQCTLVLDHTDFTPTGVQDFYAYIEPDTWNNGSTAEHYAFAQGTNSTYSWRLGIILNGTLIIYSSPDGTAQHYTTAPHGIVGGSAWIRAEYDPATGDMRLFKNTVDLPTTDPRTITWDLLDTETDYADGTQLYDSPSYLCVGGYNNGTAGLFAGSINRATHVNGGDVAIDLDFSSWQDGEGVNPPKLLPDGKYVRVGTDTTGTDTNDPEFLAFDGEKYLYLSDVNSNSLTSPSLPRAANKFRYEIEASLELPPFSGDYTSFFDHGWSTGPLIYLFGNGSLRVYSRNGEAIHSHSGVWNSLNLRQRVALEMEWNGVDTTTYRVYKWEDGAWVLFSTVSSPMAVALALSNGALRLHGAGGNSIRAIKYYSFKATVDDVVIADLDIDRDAGTSSETITDSLDVVWTIGRQATGRKSVLVDRPMFLFGADDYMECADHAALDFAAAEPLTAAIASRVHGPAATSIALAKRDGSGSGYNLHLTTASGGTWNGLFDTGATPSGGAVPLVQGRAQLAASHRDAAGATNLLVDDVAGMPDSQVGDLSNSDAVRIGRGSGATLLYADMEVMGAGIWRAALPAKDLVLASRELGVR